MTLELYRRKGETDELKMVPVSVPLGLTRKETAGIRAFEMLEQMG